MQPTTAGGFAPSGAAPPAQSPLFLLDKAQPVLVHSALDAKPNSHDKPVNTRGFNSVIVDMIPNSTAASTGINVDGAVTQGGPWLTDTDPNAVQSGITTAKRFVVTSISHWLAVSLSAPSGWDVWFTLFNAASTTTVNLSGTTNNNITEVGGNAVGTTVPVSGNVGLTGALPFGTNEIGLVGSIATNTGGYTAAAYISAASTNATNVKSSQGTLGFLTAFNLASTPRYVKVFNKATAPAPGTDTPILNVMIPANSTPTNGAGVTLHIPPQGIACSLGIGFAITAGEGLLDATAVAANDVVLNLGYA